MSTYPSGYYNVLLDINLSTKKIEKIPIPREDIEMFVGGRGLGIKIIWDRLKKPGISAFSPENPLMFMPGPFSGFPITSASRVVVVTKSPCTSPENSPYSHASTISYSNLGGFLGPEIRFAGYDGIVITGKAEHPSYIVIENDHVEIRDARSFWGMKTDELDKTLINTLDHKRFQTCYIGPAGENMVSYACVLHTAARAAGRGVGAVMGSKNLKAIAVRGTGMPGVADHRGFMAALDDTRSKFKGLRGTFLSNFWRKNGTTFNLERNSGKGTLAVKNYREGTFTEVSEINHKVAREKAWVRDFACYCCRLACKKSGAVKEGRYKTIIHDGPEFETGSLFGSNLLISDFGGLMKSIYDGDDLGVDIISAGNVIGFLMEAYEKGLMTKKDLDNIDLRWGNVDAVLKMLDKISRREGIGDLAAQGVKAISKQVGNGSHKFAIHVKGLEFPGHNLHNNLPMAFSYATSNRGACHLSGDSVSMQNFMATIDSLGLCMFATNLNRRFLPFTDQDGMADLLSAITGLEWNDEKVMELGERVFTLEKMFNYREGFRREDDWLPDRFFDEPLTVGKKKGAVLDRKEFTETLDEYYTQRNWDRKTTRPLNEKINQLGLGFTI